VKNFHFGSNDVATFIDHLAPSVRLYAKNGFRKPADVSRLLNKENKRTACGEAWTPRLAWFLLKLMFDPGAKPKRHSVPKTEIAKTPKKARILRPLAKQSENASSIATKSLENRLTADEIARRLSSFGRIVREV
jgi:hypothetical protein